MAAAPWVPEVEVTADLARRLCQAQFPGRFAADAMPIELGQGWDNRAFTLDDQDGEEWVLRFPQRAVAAPLMARELELLPRLFEALVNPVALGVDAEPPVAQTGLSLPNPQLRGAPSEDYPWCFAGYRRLVGRTACSVPRIPGAERPGAGVLGDFLGRLHLLGSQAPFDACFARDLGTGEAFRARLQRFHGRLDQLARGGFEPVRVRARAGELSGGGPWGGRPRLVHGDLYGRHLLVDEANSPVAVIDWGDAHLGDPALDLSLAWTYFAGAAREELLAAYEASSGTCVDPATLVRAQLRALEYGVTLLHYGTEVGEETMAVLGREALSHVL